MNRTITSKKSLVFLVLLNFLFLSVSGQTIDFSGLGPADSGGSGFRTLSSNSNIVVSNNTTQDGTGIYPTDGTSPYDTTTITIKADGTNAGTFQFNELYFYSFNGADVTSATKIIFKDKNGNVLQTMGLTASKYLNNLGYGMSQASTFFTTNNSTPINNVATIEFVYQSDRLPNSLTLSMLSISNIQPPSVCSLSANIVSQTNVACNGTNTGSISVSTSGGSGPYTYQWSNGSTTSNTSLTTNTISNLTAGNYSVSVTDSNGCKATTSTTITEPSKLNVFPSSQTNISCNGGSNGAATVIASGGSGGYTYSWAPGNPSGDGTPSVTGLAAGTYDVTVTDANGCTAKTSITITEPTALSASATGTNVSCNGGADGSINLSVSGGVAPYHYAWSNGAVTEDLVGVTAGSYNVTVTDDNGCTTTANVTVNEPVVLSASAIAGNVSCNGDSNGYVDLTVTGGTAPYTYLWSNNASTEDMIDLSAGTYDVTVTDAHGCTANASVTVTEPAALSASASVGNVSCNGGSDGSVDLTITGGTAPYTYAWSNGATYEDVSGVSAGNYNVTVTDAHGCTTTANATVNQPAVLSASAIASNVFCNGGSNGTVDLTVTGGTPPYTYAWSNTATTEDMIDLSAGTYDVTVTDAHGCTATTSVTVSEPTAISILTSSTVVSSNGGNDGSATAIASGGAPPYSYSWSPSGDNNSTATGLTAGIYTVTVTDGNGCSASKTVEVKEPAALKVATNLDNNVSCNGGSDGGATANVTGGAPPYQYLWSNGVENPTITNVPAGTYTIFITDNNSTKVNTTVTITEPTALSASATASNVSCNGSSNGSVDLTVTGGTAPYQYAWSNKATTEDMVGLTAGTYDVTVTDAHGCTATTSATVTEPTAISASATFTDVSCNGAANGSVDLTVTGGTSPYTYIWSNSATTQDMTGLSAGKYDVTVTDAHGCTANASVTLTEPTSLSASATAGNVSCYGGSDGSVDLTVTGGTAPYTYAWSNAMISEDISGVPAGAYSVIVTDAHGCTATTSVSVAEPTALSASATAGNVSCYGGSDGAVDLTVTGGTAPYTYTWSNSANTEDLVGLSTGTYSVIITDAHGCTMSTSVTVTEPTAISILTSATDVSSNGGNDGTATAIVSGGTAPYSYSWVPSGGNDVTATGLSAGTYTLTVTDDHGCSATKNVSVSEPAPLKVTATVEAQVSCNGAYDGAAIADVTGGTPPYQYLWSNGATTVSLTDVPAGTYNIYVTDRDGKGEKVSASVTITEPTSLTASSSKIDVNCNGGNEGSATVSASGGTAPYTYSWAPSGGDKATASGLSAGTYTVTITDAHGCSLDKSVNITEPTALSATTSTNDVTSNGKTNGSATVTVSGGSAPYTYSWSPSGGNNATASGLAAGTYTVTITDDHACSISKNVEIKEPTPVMVTTIVDANISCNGGADGAASASISGGNPPYQVLWSNGSEISSISDVPAGTYTIHVMMIMVMETP